MTNQDVADRWPQLWWFLHNVPVKPDNHPDPIISHIPDTDSVLSMPTNSLFDYMRCGGKWDVTDEEEMSDLGRNPITSVQDAYTRMYFDETQKWVSVGDYALRNFNINYVRRTIEVSQRRERALGSLVLRHVRGFSHGPEAITNTFTSPSFVRTESKRRSKAQI